MNIEIELTIERLEAGESCAIWSNEAIAGDQFEVRGPITKPFTWRVDAAAR